MNNSRQSTGGLIVVALVAAILGSTFTYGWIRVAEPVASIARPAATETVAVAPAMMDSNAVVRASEIIGPSVVNIDTKTYSSGSQQRVFRFHNGIPDNGNGGGGGGDDFFRHFFGDQAPDVQQGPPEPQKGSGSGVIVSPDGYVLTNEHVIDGANEITVTLTNKTQYKGKVVGADKLSDIAVVKIDAKDLPVATLGDSEAVRVGQWAIAVGNPYQFEHTVTVGVISGRGRTLPDGIKEYRDLLQTDAAINPGNSGGPLCDLDGRVVGINTAIIPFAQGIGFAIPINTAKNIMNQLIKTGHVTRPYVGIMMQDVSDEMVKEFKIPSKEAVRVVRVVEDSPAQKAGLEPGDIITNIDGQTFKTVVDFQSMVRKKKVGDVTTLKVYREGKPMSIAVTIGVMPDKL